MKAAAEGVQIVARIPPTTNLSDRGLNRLPKSRRVSPRPLTNNPDTAHNHSGFPNLHFITKVNSNRWPSGSDSTEALIANLPTSHLLNTESRVGDRTRLVSGFPDGSAKPIVAAPQDPDARFSLPNLIPRITRRRQTTLT